MTVGRAIRAVVPVLAAAGPALAVGPAGLDGQTPGPEARTGGTDGRAAFAVAFHGQVVPWSVFLLRALPGEEVGVEVRPPAAAVGAPPETSAQLPEGVYRMHASTGGLEQTGPTSWIWTAPDSAGMGRLVVRLEPPVDRAVARPDSIVLAAAVLVPLSEVRNGHVRRFRVGAYPSQVFRGLARYRRPRGFLRVTRENADTRVSPHFRLGQFSVRRPARWPKYTVLHERLLLKIELLVERAARRGVPTEGWRVLSGYRSPWYNRDIGRPRFSRHIFGDAADLYVDGDGDGTMDDLNADGRVDVLDAEVLYDLVDRMDADPALGHLLGGLGRYRTTPTHGPFIHLDTRGYRARW